MSVLKRLNDPQLGREMIKKIKKQAAQLAGYLGRAVTLMEVCGTHTMAISSIGLRSLLTGLVELRSGPGCPVCVTAAWDIEQMIALARVPGVTVATFGDLVRVPGALSSLERERAGGARVQIVYSPADAVTLARDNPDQEVVFLGVGFETTAPMVALSINQADNLRLTNFSVYAVHKLVPPVLRALLGAGEVKVDGLILPGHVCAVTGSKAFTFIGEEYGIPAVVTGFTPVDILDALYVLLHKIQTGDNRVVNGYRWVVRDEGNLQAQQAINDCFYIGDAIWRGFGMVGGSGLLIGEKFARYDAMRKFSEERLNDPAEPQGCRCGELLSGLITPVDCPLFGHLCTPASPAGPCMVSAEGACVAYYRYR